MEKKQPFLNDSKPTVPSAPPKEYKCAVATVTPPINQNVWQRFNKNMRQLTNILPGILLQLSAIQIYWEIREILEYAVDQKNGTQNSISDTYASVVSFRASGFLPVLLSWYVATDIGSAFGAVINNIMEVKYIYLINAILLLICAAIYMLFSFLKILPVLFIGRLVSGFIYGVNHITVITHASEKFTKRIRGMAFRWMTYSKVFMLTLALGLDGLWFTTLDAYFKFGFMYVLVAGLVLVITTKFYVDNSSPDSLEDATDNDGSGISNDMIKCRRGEREAEHSRHGLTEMTSQQSVDQPNGSNIVAIGYSKTLLLVIGGRVLGVLINCAPLLLTEASLLSIFHVSAGNLRILLFIQLLIACVIVMFSEFFKLKKFYIVLGIYVGSYIAVLFFIDTLKSTYMLYSNVYFVGSTGYILISVGANILTYNQLSDAFESTKRACSIVVVTFVESLVYLTIFLLFLDHLPDLNVIMVASIVLISALLYIFIPNVNSILLRNVRYWFKWSEDRDNIP